ncbi:hypothetical protein FRC04_010530 [Tulasnella sp. 424]|nr:hypothetical protein FRC04_010530 [Tulasnella sp. 424]KAG8972498.1 hypothetical protein FRC05_009851 [Tulasnella sp. 425]
MENLPVEVLTTILLKALNSNQRKLRRRLRLVCRTWYTIISQNSLFWTDIGLHRSAKEFREVLRLNPAGPLDVSWTPPRPHWRRGMNPTTVEHTETISSESRRWRSLTLAGYISDHVQRHLIQVPNPRLMDINVCNPDSGYGSGPHQNLPLTLGGYALRNVVLGFTTLDWDSPRLKGLRNLRLHGLRNNAPTHIQLHTIISASPELEVLGLTLCRWELETSAQVLPSLDLITLDSLTTLILYEIDRSMAHCVSSFIQAPNCSYLKIRYVRAMAVPDPIATWRLVKLLRGPLQGTSKLFVTYDERDGGLDLGTEQEEKELGVLDIREATSKLAARREIYFEIQCSHVVGDNGPQPWNDVLRTFARTVIQPALSGLNIPVRFQLPVVRSHLLAEDGRAFAAENLFEIPGISGLDLHAYGRDYAGLTSILEYLASPQPIPTTEGHDGHLCWPCPHLETIAVTCFEDDCDNIRSALDQVLSNRSQNPTKAQDESVRTPRMGDCQPRRINEIRIYDHRGSPLREWKEGEGWMYAE